MQISKKRELSRQSELKEYCGNGCCCQNLKFSLGQSLRQECWGPWREAGDAGMKCPGGNSKSCACVCVCTRAHVLGEGDCYSGGQRTVSSQRAHERQDNLRNGQKCQDSKKSIWTSPPSHGAKPFPCLRSLLRHSPTAAYRAPSPMGKSTNLQSPFNSSKP